MIDSHLVETIKERLTDRQARRGYLEQEEMELMEALADLNALRTVLIVKDDTIKFLDSKLAEAQQTIARQREALEEIKSEGAYAGNNKYYHIASAALKEGAQP